MPVTTKKLKSGKVRVSTPNGVKSKGSTPANAAKQKRLLNAVDHGWKPTGKTGKKYKSHIAKGVAKAMK